MGPNTIGSIDLGRRESLPLQDMRGATLCVLRGRLWVTQENDTRDIVLNAGDAWAVERDGLTIVEAQADTSLVVTARNIEAIRRAHRHPPKGALWRRIRAVFALLMLAPAKRAVPYF